LTSASQEGLTVKTAHAATTQMLAATMKMRIIFFPRRRGAEAEGGPLATGAEA
jgi:hypothetical protein